MSQPTLYEILSLSPTSDLTPQLIKQAYRRALLTHHPDKAASSIHRNQQSTTSSTTANSNLNSTGQRKALYTIDQISLAYTTLSSPLLRTQYDASLRSSRSSFTKSNPRSWEEDFQTGIDTIDLDDMEFVEASSSPSSSTHGKGQGQGEEKDTWYRSCRCGNTRGFALTEEDLEENADLGEVLVQCADCTIWLRVCYFVAEDVEDSEEGKR